MTFHATGARGGVHSPQPSARPFSKGVKTAAFIFGGLFVAGLTYIFSQWMYGVYYLGDQRLYTEFWNAASGASFPDIWKLQFFWTGSAEPLFGAIVWAASQFFEKALFFSFVNLTFSVLLFTVLLRYRVAPVVLPLIFFNFYNIVLLIPAERLKVSLIFVFVYLLTRGARSYAAFGLGLLTHFQNLILLAALTFVRAGPMIWRATLTRRLRPRDLIWISGLALGGLAVVLQFREELTGKFEYYFERSLIDALDAASMLALVLIFCRYRISAASAFLPVIIAAILVGQERISMVAFFVFAGFFIFQRKSLHPAFLSVLIYLDVKSIFFVQRILEYNTGFGK